MASSGVLNVASGLRVGQARQEGSTKAENPTIKVTPPERQRTIMIDGQEVTVGSIVPVGEPKKVGDRIAENLVITKIDEDGVNHVSWIVPRGGCVYDEY